MLLFDGHEKNTNDAMLYAFLSEVQTEITYAFGSTHENTMEGLGLALYRYAIFKGSTTSDWLESIQDCNTFTEIITSANYRYICFKDKNIYNLIASNTYAKNLWDNNGPDLTFTVFESGTFTHNITATYYGRATINSGTIALTGKTENCGESWSSSVAFSYGDLTDPVYKDNTYMQLYFPKIYITVISGYSNAPTGGVYVNSTQITSNGSMPAGVKTYVFNTSYDWSTATNLLTFSMSLPWSGAQANLSFNKLVIGK